jgi:probable rRNA maturation factor
MKVTLINNQNKVKLDLGLIREIAVYISDKFDRSSKGELNIILSDSKEIRELNKKYRKTDSETDVLSFSYISDKEKISPETGVYTIGEIVICPEVAQTNVLSQDKNWSLDLEITLLIIHGMLHIYDYDHKQEKDRIDMKNIQDSLISDTRRTFNI